MSPSEIDQILRTGFANQQAGQLRHAEALYGQVLAQYPNHDGALNLLAGLAMQVNRPDVAALHLRRACAIQPSLAAYHGNLAMALQCTGAMVEAIACYRRVVELQPESAQAYANLGNALLRVGKPEEAIVCYRRALELNPELDQAHNNLGIALQSQGKLDEAIAYIRRAIALQPNYAAAHNNLGLMLKDHGDPEEAIRCFRRAGELKPDDAEAPNNLGLMLMEREKIGEAVINLRRAVELRSDYPEAHNNLGLALVRQGHSEQAIPIIRRALELKPTYAEAHCSLGIALLNQKNHDEAITCFRRALELRPDFVQAHYSLGNALKILGRLDEAINSYRRALVLEPMHADAYNNLGNALHRQGKLEEAETYYDTAIQMRPDYGLAYRNRALLWLLRGEFERGWLDYEWRWRIDEFANEYRSFPQPRWNGRPLEGRTILLHAEQGLGDTLQFIRYASLVAGQGGSVIVECQPQLKRLLQGALPVSVIGNGESIPAFDVHCPLLSLPMAYQTTAKTIPGQVPYLRADENLVKRWQNKVADKAGHLKVGLAWAGNKSQNNDYNRSMTLSALAALAAAPSVCFFSLQKGAAARQAAAPPAGMQLIDYTDELTDFADTAALIANLDLVISVDTSIAHLTGAMGKPVWTLLAFVPDWRWQLDREDSPWYPTMRLFRQPAVGNWASVATHVAAALSEIGFQM